MISIVRYALSIIVVCQSASGMHEYENVIFDLGGVLIEGSVSSFVAQMKKEQLIADEKLSDATSTPAWKQWDNGIINSEKLVDSLASVYNKEDVVALLAKLMSPERPFSDECTAVLKKLIRAGYKVYVLSNLSREMYEKVVRSHPEIFDDFTGMMFSFQEHCSKPDAGMYEILLQKFHLKAQESVFIDDSINNVKIARDLDITGIHYQPGNLIEELAKIGIIISLDE